MLLAVQVCKATWRVQTVAVKMLHNTTEKQLEAFRRCGALCAPSSFSGLSGLSLVVM